MTSVKNTTLQVFYAYTTGFFLVLCPAISVLKARHDKSIHESITLHNHELTNCDFMIVVYIGDLTTRLV